MMKFGQLIECNMRNIFLEKSYRNVVKKLVPDPFLENANWAYLWINSLKFYTIYFCCMAIKGLSRFDGYQNILKLSAVHLVSPHIKLF